MKNEDSIPLSECYRYGLLSAIHVRAQIKCLTMYMNNAYTADCMLQESDRQILSFRTLFLFLFFFNGSVLTDQVQSTTYSVCGISTAVIFGHSRAKSGGSRQKWILLYA